MYFMFWIFTSTLLYSASLAVELPERPHSIFDEFLHKFNVKGGETSKHTDNDRIPRLENLFRPPNPSHSSMPEWPSKYHGFKEYNEHSPFHQDTLPPTILKERTQKPASASPPTKEFDNPKYEHSDVMNKGVPERPHSIFDEFLHKFNVKSGETPKHTDDRIPRLENFFMPSNPSHSRVPELPSKYHGFKEYNDHSPSHPDTLPPTILKERTQKPASSSPPTREFDNPKNEHSDVMNKGDEISREARENLKDLEHFKNILDEYQKQLFSRNEMSQKLSPHNLSPPSWQIGVNNEDRKHFENFLNGFAPKNHPTRNNFAERSKSSLVPTSTQLPNSLLNELETKLPVPGYGDLKHKPSHVNKIHEPSQSKDEFQRIKDFLSEPVGKFEFPNHRRNINDEKNPTAVELDFSKTNKTDMDRKVLKTLLRELPIRPDFQKVYKLKLLVKPPNDSNTAFVRDFVMILRNITTNLIPDAITAAKLTAFKKNNKTLPIFQVNLYIKYLNRWTVGKPPTTNDSYDLASEKILNNKNEAIIELEENKNNTMEIAKINLDKLTSNYKESLKSILYELLENTTSSDGFNKSIVLISIKLPNHRAFDLTGTLFKTAQSVMCAVVPDLITFDNLKLPRGKNSPRIEILIPIQETNFLHHLGYLNLTHSYENLHMEISKRVPKILNAVTRCRPENSTINFNFTMLLPQHQTTEAIRNILREVTNIARKVVPHHRIYIETQTSTIHNNLKLQLNITMKPSEIYAYHKGIEKEISIDLRRSGASMIPKIRRILPKLIREIEESSNPVSLIFNISFPLGINKDFVRNEILALITILEEAIPVQYGTIANVILQITVLPTEALRENEIIRNIKLHEYEESLMNTTESFASVEQSNTTVSNTSSSNGQDILERSTEESSVTKHAANVLYPSLKGWPGKTANQNPFWNHKPKVSYPRWRTPPISSHRTPSIFEKPHLIPLRQSLYRRRHFPQPMFGHHEKIYKTPLHSYLRNEYPKFRNFFQQSPKNDWNNWRRPVNHANFRNFPSNIRWPRITTTNSYTSETETTTNSHSNSVEKWAKSTEAPSSAVYHTPAFHFPIWQKLPSTTRKIPYSFEEIPEIYRRLNFPSHMTPRYDRFAHSKKFREPWKFYRHLQNKYDEFNNLPPHLEKHSPRHISTSWRSPLYEENMKNFLSRLRGPSETSTTPESTSLKTEASTTSFSNSVEDWTESEEISSSSVVNHTPSYEISTENSNEQPQKFYRYLKHKYHKFHKLPHHLKKQIWKKIQSEWKKAINEKKIRKFLSKIPWPRIQNSKTESTTSETSPSTSSSSSFENSSESEFSTTSNILEKLVSRSSSNTHRSLSQQPFIQVQSTPRIALHNRKYNHNRKRKHPNDLQKYRNFEPSPSLENFDISSTYFNSLLTTPTSETTIWSTTTTPSNPSSSSVENTHTTSSEASTTPTVLPSSSETETTMEVTSSETSSIENETTESSNEYTTTYSTSNEATTNNSPEQTTFPTSYSAYANFLLVTNLKLMKN
ncbi:hypothetical protein WA026_010205 [Henosepilachna vigintioctopunctata]|uniref:Uncharacterized protein n=1 Tax=Henosepilachna vigintioctopunctata TaxID=420089 RepID=A0AAW1UBF2_9CUCU